MACFTRTKLAPKNPWYVRRPKKAKKNPQYVRGPKKDHVQAKKIDSIACETAREKRVIWHARTTQTRKSEKRNDPSPVNAEEEVTVTSGIGTAAMERCPLFSMSQRQSRTFCVHFVAQMFCDSMRA
jgi:hypothetical protein